MYKPFIIIASLLIACESSFAMENQDLARRLFNKTVIEKVIPDCFVEKLDTNVLFAFKNNNFILRTTKNDARQEMLNACQNALDDLKSIVAIGCTNKSFNQQISSKILNQEKYIFETLEYLNIADDISSLVRMSNKGSIVTWRGALSQLKLYAIHKSTLQFFGYCSAKKKLNNSYSNSSSYSRIERLIHFLLKMHVNLETPELPLPCEFFGKELISKIYYHSICKEKALLLRKVIQNIANGVLLKQEHIQITSPESIDQVQFQDIDIEVSEIYQANEDIFLYTNYLIVKKLSNS